MAASFIGANKKKFEDAFTCLIAATPRRDFRDAIQQTFSRSSQVAAGSRRTAPARRFEARA